MPAPSQPRFRPPNLDKFWIYEAISLAVFIGLVAASLIIVQPILSRISTNRDVLDRPSRNINAIPEASISAAERQTSPVKKTDPPASPTPPGTTEPETPPDQILVGAGDIASCSSSGDEATATLLDGISGTVFTTGDNVYDNGTSAEFADCYDPSWGRHKSRTRPSPGNHDYNTASAAGYFGYFGAAAGSAGTGYYSYNLGGWHVVVLNSNCSQIGGCGAGSTQEQWLRSDLAANPAVCTVAYWHHPRFSSGSTHGSNASYQALWQALYDYKADLILAGHEHNYERFAPQTPAGVSDSVRGIRQFVVGTGGRSHYGFGTAISNSEVRNSDTYGVLKLTLKSASYSWQFIPEAGRSFTDSGSSNCVN